MFLDRDINQIQERGSLLSTVQEQIEYFQKGFPFLNVIKAATVGDGLIRLSEAEIGGYIQAYEAQLSHTEVVKFVPASGAASRMFKALFAYLNDFTDAQAPSHENLTKNYPDVASFFSQIDHFAFFNELIQTYDPNGELSLPIASKHYAGILGTLLLDKGLGYGMLPKGLLKFHTYGDAKRTPAEEHLVEGANYGKDGNGKVRLHFTVSPEHRSKFIAHIKDKRAKYESEFGVQFEVSFSEQKPSTDTIAVDLDNQPFRNADGSLLFRPGGHGALLENLNEIDGDIIFIKNIDNVVPDHIKSETYRFKKALAGLLQAYQTKIFEYLRQIEDDKANIEEVATFVEKELCVIPPKGFNQKSESEKSIYLQQKLNRPIRICGMVKNEGEPGGGPFWAENQDGTVSLQIAESAQIDKNNAEQMGILQHATHFNPVDLVCGVRNYKGEKFNLMPFRDPQTGFISSKSKDGRELKAQELPGLWNGSMSDWNTLFVEVPIITFNPVKKVNDLLRAEHQ